MAFDNDKYVLVLPSWYPSRVHRFNGDFNERFVKAASAEIKQIVLHVIKDASVHKIETEIIQDNSMLIYQVYYPGIKIPFIKTLHSWWLYVKLNKEYIRKIVSQQGRPVLVHCHVVQRAIVIAVWAKNRYKVPLILTEQWSAFFPEAAYSLNRKFFIYRWALRRWLNNIDHIIAVSAILKSCICQWVPDKNISVIPNVVDTGLFRLRQRQVYERFRFVHVSSMYPVKNVEGILSALEGILEKRDNVELWLVGEMPGNISSIIKNSSRLNASVIVKGGVAYAEVAQIFQQCDCLLMFSQFETFSCVAAEALCSGLPVIVTQTSGVSNYIDETNGLLVAVNDTDKLIQAMIKMMDNYMSYDKLRISDTAMALFSYQTVRNQMVQVYRSALFCNTKGIATKNH